jgi:two-component system CheB/CheR fusion protein
MIYYDAPHVFDDEEVALASTVGYLVAFAIERTRLHVALQESDRRKDTFLAILGHELRNPLAGASAALSVIAERSDDSAALRKAHDVLVRSIGNMIQLVDDLLDVSRITRGVITLEKRPVDVTSIINHALAPLQSLILSRHHELTFALEELWVEADPMRLEQIVTNLVHNAAKYTHHRGHIRVSTSASRDGIEIRVEDDGMGIDPKEIPRLFDLFEQADKSLARTAGGLGIGLTIVRELVRLHRGTVKATSEGPGRGATFTVWLPERIDRPPLGAQPVAPRERGRPQRVLVVDDNAEFASTIATLLKARGHEVFVAGDGPAAVAEVTRHEPEIVLLDIGLPGMTGYEVASHLRAAGHTALKLIAVSGYGQPDDIARSRAAGCDAHLTKPVDIARLERILRDMEWERAR